MPNIVRSSPSVLSKLVSGGGQNYGVPRSWMTSAYGSGFPIAPVSAPKDVALPRSIDYPIAVNTTLTPRTAYGLMPFSALLSAYDTVAEVSAPVQLIQRQLTGLTPRLVDADGNPVKEHPYAWMTTSPDRKTPFNVWLTRLIKSAKIYDAASVYFERAAGATQALHYIDGSTLFVLVDQFGNIPEPESVEVYIRRMLSQPTASPPNSAADSVTSALQQGTRGAASIEEFTRQIIARLSDGRAVPEKIPAFTQVIQGTPFSWWSQDEVWYMPQSRRVNAPYGESFIELAWAWIMVIVNITSFELAHYRTGNMPEGFITLPREGFSTVDEIMLAEMMYNQRMAGNEATERNRLRFFPDGSKWQETKKADFPEALYMKAWHNLLNAVGVLPSDFGDMPGAGLGGAGFKEQAASDTARQSINPHREFVASLFNTVLERDGVQEVKFTLDYALEEVDPEKQKASVYEGMAHGTLSLNDALGQLGMDAIGSPDDPTNIANKHLIVAGSTIYVIEDMQTQNGVAVPTAGGAANQAGGVPVGPETAFEQQGAEHSTEDFRTLGRIIRHVQEKGTLDGAFISLPPHSTAPQPDVKPAALPAPAATLAPAPAATDASPTQRSASETIDLMNQGLITIGYAQEQLGVPVDPATQDWYMLDGTPVPRSVMMQAFETKLGRGTNTFSVAGHGDTERPVSTEGDAPAAKLSKRDAEHADGAMIALFLPDDAAQQLRAITEGLGLPEDAELELPDAMHLTLAFLPDSAAAQAQRDVIVTALTPLVAGGLPLVGKIQGYGVFNGGDGRHVLYASFDEPALPLVRMAVCNALTAANIDYADEHGFVPHITMAYFPDSFELPAGFEVPDIPVTFDALTLAIGERRDTLPLNGEALEFHFDRNAAVNELRQWLSKAMRWDKPRKFNATVMPAYIQDFVTTELNALPADAARPIRKDVFDAGLYMLGRWDVFKAYDDTEDDFIDDLEPLFADGSEGAISKQKLRGQMNSTIRRFGLIRLREGMNAVGVDPESFDKATVEAFRAWQSEQQNYVNNFIEEVTAAGIPADDIRSRAEMWTNRTLESARELGMTLGNVEAMLKWVEDGTEDKCPDCGRLNGQVHSMAKWLESGYTPTSGKTSCKSFRCLCSLQPTDEAESGGF